MEQLTKKQLKIITSPEFIAWFGDWRNAGFADNLLTDAIPIRISKTIDRTDWKHEMKTAKKFPKVNVLLSGSKEVHVSKEFYEHTVNHARRDEVFYSIFSIGAICATAVFFDIEPNRHPKNPYIEFVECYFNVAEYNGERYIVRITVHVAHGGKRILYDLNLLKEETTRARQVVKHPTTYSNGFEYKDRKLFSFHNTFLSTISKVVDNNGNPLVVFRGDSTEFNIFDTSKIYEGYSAGFFFTDDKELASGYGTVKEYFINIKNLKEITDNADFVYKEQYKESDADGFVQSFETEKGSKFKNYIATLPTQIKLANGENAAFDGSNPDVRYSQGGEIKSRSLVFKIILGKWH